MKNLTALELQLEELNDRYYGAMAIAKTYYRRASQPFRAHNYSHNISKAAEYSNKAKALGRLINKLECEEA